MKKIAANRNYRLTKKVNADGSLLKMAHGSDSDKVIQEDIFDILVANGLIKDLAEIVVSSIRQMDMRSVWRKIKAHVDSQNWEDDFSNSLQNMDDDKLADLRDSIEGELNELEGAGSDEYERIDQLNDKINIISVERGQREGSNLSSRYSTTWMD